MVFSWAFKLGLLSLGPLGLVPLSFLYIVSLTHYARQSNESNTDSSLFLNLEKTFKEKFHFLVITQSLFLFPSKIWSSKWRKIKIRLTVLNRSSMLTCSILDTPCIIWFYFYNKNSQMVYCFFVHRKNKPVIYQPSDSAKTSKGFINTLLQLKNWKSLQFINGDMWVSI